MRWKEFLTPTQSMSAEKAKDAMAARNAGTYLLLDVRQSHEYEQSHIPGAKLLPLPELMDHLQELDPDKPTYVYCAVGGRSRVAAQLLSGQGFREVINMKGGIQAWEGKKAVGPVETETIPFDDRAEPESIIPLAYGLEEGLRSFYDSMSSLLKGEQVVELFQTLASVEVQHKQQLLDLYAEYSSSAPDQKTFEADIEKNTMEGGYTTEEYIANNQAVIKTAQDVIELAMTIEAQALDLYSRLAVRSEVEPTRKIFYALVDAEKIHLKKLGELFDKTDKEVLSL
jgi:rhodanese-related sulfurtransferase/rubrerythrin